MKGNVIFKLKQAEFENILNSSGNFQCPYAKIKIGWHSKKVPVIKYEDKTLFWSDFAVLKRKHQEMNIKIKIKDLDKFGLRKKLGEVKINLEEIVGKRKKIEWYDLSSKNKIIGKIQIEIDFDSEAIPNF